jgi:hypothetical protein
MELVKETTMAFYRVTAQSLDLRDGRVVDLRPHAHPRDVKAGRIDYP